MTPELSNDIMAGTTAGPATAGRRRDRFVFWSGLALAAILFGAWAFVSRGASSAELMTVREFVWKFCEESDPHRRRDLAQQAEPLLGKIMDRGDSEAYGAVALQMALSFERGRTDEAARLRPRVSLSSSASADLALAAVIFAQAREVSVAERFVTAALKNSSDVVTLRAAAMALYEMERGDEVLDVCHKWSQRDTANPEPYRRILQVQDDRGLIHLSAEACRQLLQRHINDRPEVQLKLINLLIQMGSTTEAREQFAAASADRPHDTASNSSAALDWRVTEARLTHAESDILQTERLLQQVLTVDPRNADALLLQGQLLLSASEIAKATSAFEQVVAQRPLDGQAHYLLGQAYARDQQADLAQIQFRLYQKLRLAAPRIRVLQRVLARRPEDHESRRNLNDLYADLEMQPPEVRQPE